MIEETESERLNIELTKTVYQKEEIIFLKNLYTQEPKLITATKEIQKASFTELIDILERENPVNFYYKAAELLSIFKFDQAAFLINLGQLRFKYYNMTNPEYTKSGDGALATSLNYLLAEPISKYYKANIDNYIAVLNACISWHSQHDYKFGNVDSDTSKYNQLTSQLIAIRDIYIQDKETLQKQWIKDVEEFMQSADKDLKKVENRINEIKAKLLKLKGISKNPFFPKGTF